MSGWAYISIIEACRPWLSWVGLYWGVDAFRTECHWGYYSPVKGQQRVFGTRGATEVHRALRPYPGSSYQDRCQRPHSMCPPPRASEIRSFNNSILTTDVSICSTNLCTTRFWVIGGWTAFVWGYRQTAYVPDVLFEDTIAGKIRGIAQVATKSMLRVAKRSPEAQHLLVLFFAISAVIRQNYYVLGRLFAGRRC